MTEHFTITWAPNLPSDWRDAIDLIVKAYGTDVKTKGRGPGSLESDDTAGLDYRVVGGEAIRDNATWLWDWYQSDEMKDLVQSAVGEPVKPSGHVPSAINVNYLRGHGSRYELHTDSQPYVAVLMTDECDVLTGGRLMLHLENGVVPINTQPGMLVIFDGSKVPHAVEPLNAQWGARTSLPLVYLSADADERPSDLDAYLYGDPEK